MAELGGGEGLARIKIPTSVTNDALVIKNNRNKERRRLDDVTDLTFISRGAGTWKKKKKKRKRRRKKEEEEEEEEMERGQHPPTRRPERSWRPGT